MATTLHPQVVGLVEEEEEVVSLVATVKRVGEGMAEEGGEDMEEQEEDQKEGKK